MAAPAWITTPDLGSYAEDYSFSLNPITVLFSAPAGTSLNVLNGGLPPGIEYQRSGNTILIRGESAGTDAPFVSRITWRLRAPDGSVADRTYSIGITPVTSPPSWSGQDPDLGYAIEGQRETYTVRATTTTDYEVSYDIASFYPPAGMSMDSYTGVITYYAPPVAVDTQVSFNVIAKAGPPTGPLSSTLPCTITVLALPHAPVWLTPPGLVAEVDETQLVEVLLQALEPNGGQLSFSLSSASPSFPFSFDNTTTSGDTVFIYGDAPEVFAETSYTFTVTASSAYGSSSRTFEILSNPVEPGSMLRWAEPSGDLGIIDDGQYVVINVGAISNRGPVTHSIVGGILPTHLILDRIPGVLMGFLEFQTRDRYYLFDVRATDGVQTIERTFYLGVRRATNCQYMGISIPLEGPMKDAYYSFVGNLIDPAWVPFPGSFVQNMTFSPSIQLINGLNYAIDNPSVAVGFANLHMHTTSLMIGATTNVNVTPTTTLFYSPILDSDAGAEYQYAPIGNAVCNASATLAVQTGEVTVQTSVSERDTWITNGSQVRLVYSGNPANFMQGTVTLFTNSFMTVNVTAKGGSGTWNSWQVYPAEQYPPSLENARTDLISGLGWVSDGQGSGATLLPMIDLATGGISNVQVVGGGSGFLYSPAINVVGQGNGAVIGANLTITGCSINHPGAGYANGTSYVLTAPAVSKAVVSVGNVTATGSITQLDIVYGGEYSRFPSGTYMLYDPNVAIQAEITFDLGIGNVTVVSAGSGYSSASTGINTAGREILPSWQESWFPFVGCGRVWEWYGDNVVRRETPELTDSWWYLRFPWQHAVLELQGIEWTGDTTFEDLQTSFDGGTTFFAEWVEPRNTLFEQDLTTFDRGDTYFDWNVLWGGVAYAAWGTTLFDRNVTVFDLYSTTFDDSIVPTRSITLLRKLLRVTTTQYSGHNVLV